MLGFPFEIASDRGGIDPSFSEQIPDVVQVPALEALHHATQLLDSRLRQAVCSNRMRLWLVFIAVQQKTAFVAVEDQLVSRDVELDDSGPRRSFRSNELDAQLRCGDQR